MMEWALKVFGQMDCLRSRWIQIAGDVYRRK